MLGLVINPVAGIGGPAGLAGSDGADVQSLARERGSAARAAERAVTALEMLPRGSRVLTAAGSMGADAAATAGVDTEVVYAPAHGSSLGEAQATVPADTTAAVRALTDAGATLVLFSGGDGTARDVAAALRDSPSTAALGIPAGVKMYSPVFAVSPRAAGALAADWLEGALPTQQCEVLDVDEAALRRARVEPRLYGTLPVPYRSGRTQARKAASPASEHAAVVAAARSAVSAMRPGVRYLLGPGGTMAEVARALGVEKTPLGVDVVLDGALVRRGASELELLDEITHGPAKAIVSIIGGQGFVLGRGNQQLSARVIRALGADPLVVVAPESKLIELHGRPLLVDTGDPESDAAIGGYVRVITGLAASSFYPVHAPEISSEHTSEITEESHAS
ncbi:ATP-NAD kinase family protein [Microbacterium sp. C7(2022)]|uniref:ATP-NAD kinase family protein n=1 Tax=Microbacterium sp. C7(2022) TaxID=2992759 RepID=UPI00237A5BCB|nr:ATP-NAD kinase family protein [Microbacterium sp. C7(2022)]MDE0545370.1 ATP-NAD kinase family protein [Microbacterium sp. C7(2022)]